MRKLLRLLVVIAALSAPGTAVAQEVFRVYWNNQHRYRAYQEVFDRFASEHGVALDIQTFTWPDMRARLLADASGGTLPDLIEVPGPWVAELGGRGVLLELTEQVEAWPERGDWFETTWDEVTFEDEIYGVKLHHTAFALFFNKALFQRAGLPAEAPRTLSEFRDAAGTITKALGPEVTGFSFDADPGYLFNFFASEQVPQLIVDGRIAIDTPEVRRSLAILKEIAANRWALIPEPGASYESARRAFIDGRTAMMVSGPWDIASLQSNAPDLDYGLAPVPVLEGQVSRAVSAGTAVAVGASSEQDDLAWELIQRLTAVDVELAATREAGMLMPRKAWAASPELAAMPKVAAFAPLLRNATAFDLGAQAMGLPEITGDGDVFKLFYENLLYGRLNPDEALSAYVEEANEAIEDAR